MMMMMMMMTGLNIRLGLEYDEIKKLMLILVKVNKKRNY